jgi:hypothetical protein
MERGEWKDAVDGKPQGAGISPLLANVFLHYVLDLWVHRWRRQAHGCVSVVRYANDFVMAFESEVDARKMLAGLTERLVKFGLALHQEKTRLIMFGKYAAERRQRLGKGRPETFDFLGFTHYCATSRDGKFIVKRKTQRKRKITAPPRGMASRPDEIRVLRLHPPGPSASDCIDNAERRNGPVRLALLEVARLAHQVGDMGEAQHRLPASASKGVKRSSLHLDGKNALRTRRLDGLPDFAIGRVGGPRCAGLHQFPCAGERLGDCRDKRWVGLGIVGSRQVMAACVLVSQRALDKDEVGWRASQALAGEILRVRHAMSQIVELITLATEGRDAVLVRARPMSPSMASASGS